MSQTSASHYHNRDRRREYEDPQLSRMTKEEENQRIIEEIINSSSKNYSDNSSRYRGDEDFIEKQEEEDIKNELLEKIALLREILTDEQISLANIHLVDNDNSLGEIRSTLRTLRNKNNRNRNTYFAEDCIIGFSYGMEELCNGKNEYFGRKPDLRGWSRTVNTKLRRMRPDTSEIAQNVTEGIGIGPGARILIELIPSMFIYSRKRQATHNSHAVNATEVSDAISDITKDD